MNESPAKVKVESVNQIAIAVKDIEKTAQNYWNILGIGPWAIYDWEAPLVYEREYHGKPVVAREKIAVAQVGGVELELVQAVDGPSIYGDWVEEHGEGLHHMNFVTDNVDHFDRTVKTLVDEGFPCLQIGRFGRPDQRYSYGYIDIPPLHTIWEPIYESDIDVKPVMLPENAEEGPAKVKVESINQIAIAVKDIEKTAQNYWNILGIGPWAIYDWEAPLVYEREYHGKPVVAREKIAVTQVGGVELELVQAVDGPSIYGDWVEEHGEGLHHLNFLFDKADNLDKTVETLAREGFPSIQSGRFGRPDQRYGFNYIDIPPLRTIWEPVYENEIDVKPIMFPLDGF